MHPADTEHVLPLEPSVACQAAILRGSTCDTVPLSAPNYCLPPRPGSERSSMDPCNGCVEEVAEAASARGRNLASACSIRSNLCAMPCPAMIMLAICWSVWSMRVATWAAKCSKFWSLISVSMDERSIGMSSPGSSSVVTGVSLSACCTTRTPCLPLRPSARPVLHRDGIHLA